MKVVIAGGSGFIGTALRSALVERGDRVIQLVRRPAVGADEVQWDPASSEDVGALVSGADALVNMGGAAIGGKRWSQQRKQLILDSRLNATSSLVRAISHAEVPPSLFLSMSAIGYYGDRGDELLHETSAPGTEDFVSSVASQWEAAAEEAASHVPVVKARTGIVLGASGGALRKLLLPFRLGLGGRLGDGKQWFSWISLHDEVRALMFLLDRRQGGTFNLVAPGAVTNAEFTRQLGVVMRRPTRIPAPTFVLNALLGKELAHSLLFSSAKVSPTALTEAGFEFRDPTLSVALEAVLRG